MNAPLSVELFADLPEGVSGNGAHGGCMAGEYREIDASISRRADRDLKEAQLALEV